MGKPQVLSKRQKKLAKKKGNKGAVLKILQWTHKSLPRLGLDTGEGPSSGAKYTIDQILDKAEGFIEEYNYTLAQKFCQRALEMDGDNVRALETCASLLLEVRGRGLQQISRCVNYATFLNLGW